MSEMPRKAEHLLADEGVFKGHEGLRRLSEAADFWQQQPYGTRLYFGHGGLDYLHRSVLEAALSALDKAATLKADLAALREQVAEERDLVEKLQRALMFWMPAIAGSGTEAGERAAADAYLLVGYAGPFEKSAEDRKWVRASVFARGEGEVIEAGDVIHSRGLPFRLVYDAEVEGANGDLSRNLCK